MFSAQIMAGTFVRNGVGKWATPKREEWIYGLTPVQSYLRGRVEKRGLRVDGEVERMHVAVPWDEWKKVGGKDGAWSLKALSKPRRALVRHAQELGISIVGNSLAGLNDLTEKWSRSGGSVTHQGVVMEVGAMAVPDSFGPSEKWNVGAGALPGSHGVMGGGFGEKGGLMVLLDCIEDPQNLGSVLRTAAFHGIGMEENGAKLIGLSKGAPLTGGTSKASAGAMELMEGIVSIPHPLKWVRRAREAGWRIVVTVPPGPDSMSLDEWKASRDSEAPEGLVVILGNEGAGVRPLLLEQATDSVHISGATGVVDSLNVGVAAGIVMNSLTSSNDAQRLP